MDINHRLLTRIKRIEKHIAPEVIHFPLEKRQVIKVGEVWQVAKLDFPSEFEAIAFSKQLQETGITAYLDEIERLLLEQE